MKIYKDSDSVCEIKYHVVFCTKYRNKVIVDAIEIELKKILAEICEEYEWKLEKLETMPDHVHLLINADSMIAPADIVDKLKLISAVHIFAMFPKIKGKKFWGSGLWSRSTYYGTVGHVSEETIKKYIEDQKSH